MDKRRQRSLGLIVLAGGLICGFVGGVAILMFIPGWLGSDLATAATASEILTGSDSLLDSGSESPTATASSLPRIVPAEGAPAPDFELTDLDGETVSLSASSGKIVLINFWATWCAPCRSEMSVFQDRYERYANQGFEILAVNGDSPLGEVIAFRHHYGLSFPIVVDGDDSVQTTYRIRLFPTSFIIDRDGIIRFVVYGPLEGPQLDRYLAEIGIDI